MQSFAVLGVSHRVLAALLVVSGALGLLVVWQFWAPGGWATGAGGIPLLVLSLAGGVAAWLILRRRRAGLLLATGFFGLQIIGIDLETISWSFQAGLTMEFAIRVAGFTVILNVVALILAIWSALLFRRSGR